MAYWLMKQEPESYGIADLERDGHTGWDGVRNYQARNSMQAMRVGDKVLYYHSNAQPSGVAGLAQVVHKAYPDPTQFDPRSPYFDPKATLAAPRWFQVDVGFVERFPQTVSLEELKEHPRLLGMQLLSGKAMRLSIQAVSKAHYDLIARLGRKT